jgi:hypothetical protein
MEVRMPKTMKLGTFDQDHLRLLVRLADVDLPRRFVVACAWFGKFYVGDLIRMRGIASLCRSESEIAAVKAYLAGAGLALDTEVEHWTSDRAALMEGLVFGFAEPSVEILALGMDRLDLDTRAANWLRDETIGSIAEMSRDAFMRIPNAGKDARHEVREALARVGVAFSGEIAVASRVDQALVRRLLAEAAPG